MVSEEFSTPDAKLLCHFLLGTALTGRREEEGQESETIFHRCGSGRCGSFLDLGELMEGRGGGRGGHKSKFHFIFEGEKRGEEGKGKGKGIRKPSCLVDWMKQRMKPQQQCGVTLYCDMLASLSCHFFGQMVERLQFCAIVLGESGEGPEGWGWEEFFQVCGKESNFIFETDFLLLISPYIKKGRISYSQR